MNNDPRPSKRRPLTTSGTYRINLRKPNVDFVYAHDDKTVSTRLWFDVGADFYVKKPYGTRWPDALALLVGKLSGRFTEALPKEGVTAEQFVRYIEPACDKPMDVEIVVEPIMDEATGHQAEYKGEPKWKYNLRFKKGKAPASDIPAKDKPNGGEAIEF
jgi:hypothetical protein